MDGLVQIISPFVLIQKNMSMLSGETTKVDITTMDGSQIGGLRHSKLD